MNDDVLDHIIKLCKNEMRMCKSDYLIHVGGKESALETYKKVLEILMQMRETGQTSV